VAQPRGSIKGAPAASIVLDAEKRGLLQFHSRANPAPARVRPVDSSTRPSGNTGIAYAMLGAALDFPVTLCVPSNVSHERKNILAATVPRSSGRPRRRLRRRYPSRAARLASAEPGRYMYADQYGNDQNWRPTTAPPPRDWRQTEGLVTHFIAGLGTSGTFMGTTRRLRELNPKIRCISMQPDSPFNGFEGLKHMATAIVPAIYDVALADGERLHGTERAYDMARELGRRDGLLVGVSAAGAVATASDRPARGPRRTRGRHRRHPRRLRRKIPLRTLLAGGIGTVTEDRTCHFEP